MSFSLYLNSLKRRVYGKRFCDDFSLTPDKENWLSRAKRGGKITSKVRRKEFTPSRGLGATSSLHRYIPKQIEEAGFCLRIFGLLFLLGLRRESLLSLSAEKKNCHKSARHKSAIFYLFGYMQGLFLLSFICLNSFPASAAKTHGISTFNQLSYPSHFTHFGYTNPQAPKGGQLRMGQQGTFDSLNPFIIKGTPANGISLLYARLLESAKDVPGESYAYVAQDLEIAPDRLSVTFFLNKKARFSDHTPITADDVIWSFETLRDKGIPLYRTYYKNVIEVEKIDNHTVKFHFNTASNTELPNILGQLPVLPRRFYEKVDFSSTSLELPPTSGPYMIETLDAGRSITYKRVHNWWGQDIPSQKGSHNFDFIHIDYYLDSTAIFEAFKGGKIDLRLENIAKNWAVGYNFPAAEKGWVVRKTLTNKLPGATYGLFFNTRRPLFKDRTVRHALSLCLNFKWLNEKFFYNLYQRNLSYYPNSDFAAKGLPGTEEIHLLQPFKDVLPSEVFNQAFTLPEPATEVALRKQLEKAQELLEHAGWTIQNNFLKNTKTGENFEFDILINDRALEKVILNFKETLQNLGIKVNVRLLDTSSYTYRLEHLEYDMIVGIFPQSATIGNEQRDFFGSKKADSIGTYNFAGIKNKAIDSLIEKLVQASSYKELCIIGQAIDRSLLWEYYMIPAWHSAETRFAYWDKFAFPPLLPAYTLLDFTTWWYDEKKAERLKISMQEQSQSRIKSLWKKLTEIIA